MSDIKNQLIKDSYNYVLQSDINTGVVYRIGGDIPVNPTFLSGLTINSGFTFQNGTEFDGYVLTSDANGNARWAPVSGASVSSVTAGNGLSGDTTTGSITLVNTAPDKTVVITGGTGIQIISSYPNFGINFTGQTSFPYLPLSGGTVTGNVVFQSGLTANTLTIIGLSSATDSKIVTIDDNGILHTYPISGITGGTGSGVTSINTSGIGLTANTTTGAVTITNTKPDQTVTITGGTNIQITGTYPNFGITVTGSTSGSGAYLPLSGGTLTGDLIAPNITATTLNATGLTTTNGITSTGGITFKQVTINSPYTATTSDYMIDVTGGTFSVVLPSAVGIQGRLLVVKNNGGGAVTVQPVSGQTIDGKPFVILGETNTIQLASNGSEWVAISYNISTVNSSTGVFEFTGLSISSTTTFNVAPIKGWIVDDTTNPLSPQLYYVAYSGGVHTAIYVNTSTETWVYLTSGGTISQSSIELTEQQRRQNIFLGKLGHANKTNIINAFSQPDFVLSPLAQLRDMFVPINLINGGIYASPNGANLSFNTSAGYLYGLGINFASDTLSPNALYVSGTSPCTFQYRTQTGGTASNTTFIDPKKYDVGGGVRTITGTKATNQRIYLVQNGIFRVQYGQTEYNQLSAAIEGIATEQFNTFSNFTNNGILIGVLSVLSTATNLSDTSKARFFFTSKFGETVGSAGGVSTTNLQQAYDNSVTPEITTNSTLDALSLKNGTGNADNVTNLFEGVNTSGSITSFIRADGLISGNTLSTPSFTANANGITATTISASTITANAITATTISAATYQNLPNTLYTGNGTLSSNRTVNQNELSLTFTGTTASTLSILEKFKQGASSNNPSGIFSHAQGIGTTANGDYSHSEGVSSGAFGAYSHAEGSSTAIGTGSHSEGDTTIASGNYSHAEGSNTQSNGNYSHSEGHFSRSSGTHSHAEGFYTDSNGEYSHSEGYYTNSVGLYSHSEGAGYIIDGSNTFEPLANNPLTYLRIDVSGVTYEVFDGTWVSESDIVIIGDWSAIPADSIVSRLIFNSFDVNLCYYGPYYINRVVFDSGSGQSVVTFDSGWSGIILNAITGCTNISNGIGSHSEGLSTRANGNYSHSEGIGTYADGEGQHVSGKYNITGNTTSLFVIGNGTDDDNRSDILNVNQNEVNVFGNLNAPYISGDTFDLQYVTLSSTSSGLIDYLTVISKETDYGVSVSLTPNGNPIGYGYAFQFAANNIANSLLFVGDNLTKAHYIHTDSTNVSAEGWPLIFGVTPQNDNWDANSNLLVLTSGQTIGIGVRNPTNKLHISGSTNPIRIQGLTGSTTDNLILSIDSTGVVHTYPLSGLTGGSTITITGGTNIQITGSHPNFGVSYTGQTSFPYLPLSGGTVTGSTNFTGGLTANTISASTYYNISNYNSGVIVNSDLWINNNDGTMTFPTTQVALYSNTAFTSSVEVYTVSGQTTGAGIPALSNEDTNYIVIDYNNGNPVYDVLTDDSTINSSNIVLYLIVYRANNFVHVLDFGNEGAGLPNKLNDRIIYTDRFAREDGFSLGLSGTTGVVTLSSGVAWNGTNRQTLVGVNSTDDVFFQSFHSGGTWTYTTTSNTLNNLFYDNGTNRIAGTAGKYLVNWYFRGQEINDHLYEVWGNDEYDNVSEAQLSLEPNLPELITSHAFLTGRIIVQVSAMTGTVESAFAQVFQPSTVQSHNDLTGIQGGTGGEYYHLTSSEYNNVAYENVSNTFTSGQIFNAGLTANTISGGTIYGDGSNLTNVVNSITTSTGLSGSSTNGNITLINTSPDQTVTISGGTNIQITGSYPNFGVNFTGTTGSGGTFTGGTVPGETYFASGLTANTLVVTATTDPVKFVGLQSASDTDIVTTDGTGVLHTRPISSLSSITWSAVTTSQNALVNYGFITNSGSLVVLTLPTTASVGSIIEVVGIGSGGWKIAQNSGQIIHFGIVNSTTGTGGFIASTQTYDSVRLLCTTTDTDFTVLSSVGNIDIN